MRRRALMIFAALFAVLALLSAPPAAKAQVSEKECKKTCKNQKKACQQGFKEQAKDAKAECKTSYDAAKQACGSDNACKKDAKTEFKACKNTAKQINAQAKSCVSDAEGFKTCKTCCGGDDPGSCGVAVCGDDQLVAPEECDDGLENSNTAADACRATCQLAGCGDGVQDTGEGCDNGTSNSDTTADACRTTCQPASCGDGVQDAGEGCDDGANNSDATADACRTDCQPAGCGDNVKDANDECDGSDDDACPSKCGIDCTCLLECGDNQVDAGEECDGTDDDACGCPGSCLSNCSCFRLTRLAFTTVAPGGNCGRVNDDPAGTGTDLVPYGGSAAQLQCGTLYIGGGGSVQPPSPTPDGATSIFNIACGDPTSLVLSATTSTDTGSNQSCTSPGCFFGPPLPIPNPGSTPVSTCVINAIAAAPAAGGTLNAVAGTSTTTLPLTVRVRVTGDLQPDPGIQPCPTCSGGTCNSGANSGGTCTSTTSLLTSHDCPPMEATLAPFGVDLSPLTTGNAMRTAGAGDGNFCAPTPGQRSAGALGQPSANFIETQGVPAGDLTTGQTLAATQSSVFCIPKSGSSLVDTVADLPGPGAVTLKGSSHLE